MIAGDSPLIFGDFDYLVITGLGVDGLEVDYQRIVLRRDAGVDWADFTFVSVQAVVMMTEQAAERGCGGPV